MRWRKSRSKAALQTLVRLYRKTPAQLDRLGSLIAGDTIPAATVVSDSTCTAEPTDAFFARWLANWSKKLTISKYLGPVANDLQHSACRTARALHVSRSAERMALDLSGLRSIDETQLASGLSAIDVFPRCALLLVTFEGLSIDDAAVLLGVDKRLVVYAESVGLQQLVRNLTCEQQHLQPVAAAQLGAARPPPSIPVVRFSKRLPAGVSS
jgi:hypothetical protein